MRRDDSEVCLAIAVEPIEDLPPIDERLALPEAGYEIIDGVVRFVPPADEPHANRHSRVSMLVATHVAREFTSAIDMLTRTSTINDLAPDVSVYPTALDPITGGRQLEHLAFEIVSTQSMSDATTKAADLVGRGVRRVFAIDVRRRRVCEWSRERAEWRALEDSEVIEDPTLVRPLPAAALLDVVNAENEVFYALVAKDNPALVSQRAKDRSEGEVEGHGKGLEQGRLETRDLARFAVIAMLTLRGLTVLDAQRDLINAEQDLDRLSRWLRAAERCTDVRELLDS